MPRSKFQRQYLYVSDAQYLSSNVDLSEHYQKSGERQSRLQLRPLGLLAPASQLDQNIRLALSELLGKSQASNLDELAKLPVQQEQQEQQRQGQVSEASAKRARFSASSVGSSADSGVFPSARCSSADSSSSASLASSAGSQRDWAPGHAHPAYTASPRAAEPAQPGPDICLNCGTTGMLAGQLDSEDGGEEMEEEEEEEASGSGSGSSQPSSLMGSQPSSSTCSGPNTTAEQLEFGQCALDWHLDSHSNYHRNKLVALISAGMTTGSDKKYVTDTVTTLSELGYEVCVFIRRGVGGLKLSSARFFSPAKWRDFEAAVLSVKRQRPDANLVAIGYSFGSIELCRYLSMSGSSSQVKAALLISCPFDPEAGGRNMRKRLLNRRIDTYLARSLGKQLHQAMFSSQAVPVMSSLERHGTNKADPQQNLHDQTLEKSETKPELASMATGGSFLASNYNGSLVDLAKLPKIKSLVEFEDNYNRLLQNYPNSEAYAADSRLQNHLARIKTPTLCLSSEDDFMAPLKLLPLDQIRANESLCMVLTKRGGHMAFIDGLLWPKRPYFAQRIITGYLGAVRDQHLRRLRQTETPAKSALTSHQLLRMMKQT